MSVVLTLVHQWGARSSWADPPSQAGRGRLESVRRGIGQTGAEWGGLGEPLEGRRSVCLKRALPPSSAPMIRSRRGEVPPSALSHLLAGGHGLTGPRAPLTMQGGDAVCAPPSRLCQLSLQPRCMRSQETEGLPCQGSEHSHPREGTRKPLGCTEDRRGNSQEIQMRKTVLFAQIEQRRNCQQIQWRFQR